MHFINDNTGMLLYLEMEKIVILIITEICAVIEKHKLK